MGRRQLVLLVVLRPRGMCPSACMTLEANHMLYHSVDTWCFRNLCGRPYQPPVTTPSLCSLKPTNLPSARTAWLTALLGRTVNFPNRTSTAPMHGSGNLTSSYARAVFEKSNPGDTNSTQRSSQRERFSTPWVPHLSPFTMSFSTWLILWIRTMCR